MVGGSYSALLAFGFVNAALLGGLALVAAPVIIHLLSRRRYRRLSWGATRFLLEAEKETRRRVRFEQWLLLALRCLAMALLALLVARPFVQPSALAALVGGRGGVARVVVIDDSASMGARSGATDELSGVAEAAHRLLSWLSQESGGDRVTVYLTSQPQEPLIADARLDPTNVQEIGRQLAELRPTVLAARPRGVLAVVADAIRADRDAARTDIYIFSDCQRTDWLAADAAANPFDPLAQLAREAERSFRVLLVRTTTEMRSNVAVAALEFERAHLIASVPAVLRARVANFGPRRLEGLTARLELDGAALPPVPVPALDSEGEQTLSVEVAFPDAGFHELAMSLEARDSLPLDDTRRIAADVLSAVSVLIVNGAPSADTQADEVHLLRSALAPPGPFSSGNRVEVVDPRELEGTALADFDCIFLCNVPPLSEAAVEQLERFARGGGGVVFFLGDQVDDVAAFNAAFHRGGAGLLPLALDRELAAPQQSGGVGLLQMAKHPITAAFGSDTDALSEYVRFRRYFSAVDEAQTATTAPASAPGEPPPSGLVLATYTNESRTPAIVEHKFGRGTVLLFTSTADLDWNDWPRATDGSYVVAMLETVQYAARRDDYPRQVAPGAPLVLSVSADQYERTAVLRSPLHPQEPAVPLRGQAASQDVGAPLVFTGPPARQVGVYRLDLSPRGGAVETHPLCVNLEPGESDLRVATAAELDAALAGVPHELLRADESFRGGSDDTRRELWRTVLVVLVGLLLGEQFLAWWFGGAQLGARRRGVRPART